MSAQVNKRIFGSRIPQEIQDKLNLRQNLNRQDRKAGESIGDDYANNYNGIADLSSRTPIARLWTGVQVVKYTYPTDDNDLTEVQEDNMGTEVYIVGNNLYNNQPITPNNPIMNRQKNDRDMTATAVPGKGSQFTTDESKKAFPLEFEQDNNKFFDAPAGIKSITTQTEGLGAVKKTTVNIRVYNYADYENIYLKYFLRPGAKMFIDFGWDTARSSVGGGLYNPDELLAEPDLIVDKLYGDDGYVTNSNGDLEVLYGEVINYTSKVGDDGSVDISLEILSSGTALISKDMSKGDSAKVRRKISFGLDLIIMKHLDELGYVNLSNVPTDGAIYTDYERSKSFNEQATRSGFHTPLSNKQENGSYVGNYDTSDAGVLNMNIGNYPSVEATEAGVFFADKSTKDATTSNMYISLGLFEDLVLNREFGFGSDFDDVLEGKNSIRFDSSNHYIRWDEALSKRQGKADDVTKISYLFPQRWDKTYNTIVGKSPDYPDTDEQYKEAVQNRYSKTVRTINKINMTQEQKTESILQYEYQKYQYQTIDNTIIVTGGYEGNPNIAKHWEWLRPPYRTRNVPFCVNLGGQMQDSFGNPLALGDFYSYSPGVLGSGLNGSYADPPRNRQYCGQHGNWDLNGGYDLFVASVSYEGDANYNDIFAPLEESVNSKYYIPTYHGDDFVIIPHKSMNGLVKDKKYVGGNFGYIEEIVETSDPDEFTNTQFDKELRRIPARDLFISVPMIKKAFINNTKLSDVLKEICENIKKDSGDILDLQVSTNDYSGTKLSFIDKNFVESEIGIINTEYFMFNINNNSTLVKSFDINYEIPSDDYSAVLAIQAMTGKELIPTDTTMDYILSDKLIYNQSEGSKYGLKYQPYIGSYQAEKIQSYSTKKGEEITGEDFDETAFVSDGKSSQISADFYSTLTSGMTTNPNAFNTITVNASYQKPAVNTSTDGTETQEQQMKTDDNILSLQNLTDEKVYADNTEDWYLSIAKNQYFYQVSSTLMPFEVTLRIYGISSLAIGDTFQVSYLPERYRLMTYFQVTGISHNVENSGWTTEITSVMRMKSQVKKNPNIIESIIVEEGKLPKPTPWSGAGRLNLRTDNSVGQVPIALDPSRVFTFNGKAIQNPLTKKIVSGMTDLVPIDVNFGSKFQTRLHGENSLQFTWSQGEYNFYDMRTVIAFYDGMWNPIHPTARQRWKRCLKNEQILETNNPNLTITLRGDKAPPQSQKPYMLDNRRGNSEGWLEGTTNMAGLKRIIPEANKGMYAKYINDPNIWRNNNWGSGTRYWVFTYTTKLVEGEKYMILSTRSFSESLVLPLSTDLSALDDILPAIFPAAGNPLLPGEFNMSYDYYNQYKQSNKVLEIEDEPNNTNPGNVPGWSNPSNTPT